jgi:hypothetical protein
MKDLEKFLKVLSDGMKSLAKGFESVAEKVETMAKSEGMENSPPKKAAQAKAAKPARKPVKKTTVKKAAPKTAKKSAPKKKTALTATEAVYQIISRSKNGAGTAALKKKTGFPDKKIHNIIYKLKKQGKIISQAKGVYAKV